MSLNSRGFTLVEVMISAVIMFSALAIGSLAYRTSVRSVDRIKANVLVADAIPAIMPLVKKEILEQKIKGDGSYGSSIRYTWNLKEIKSSKNILSSYDERTGGLEYGRFRVALNRIELNIIYEQDSLKKETLHEYRELSWSN